MNIINDGLFMPLLRPFDDQLQCIQAVLFASLICFLLRIFIFSLSRRFKFLIVIMCTCLCVCSLFRADLIILSSLKRYFLHRMERQTKKRVFCNRRKIPKTNTTTACNVKLKWRNCDFYLLWFRLGLHYVSLLNDRIEIRFHQSLCSKGLNIGLRFRPPTIDFPFAPHDFVSFFFSSRY